MCNKLPQRNLEEQNDEERVEAEQLQRAVNALDHDPTSIRIHHPGQNLSLKRVRHNKAKRRGGDAGQKKRGGDAGQRKRVGDSEVEMTKDRGGEDGRKDREGKPAGRGQKGGKQAPRGKTSGDADWVPPRVEIRDPSSEPPASQRQLRSRTNPRQLPLPSEEAQGTYMPDMFFELTNIQRYIFS